jgi:small subunit ribosomal protein S9
MAAAKKYYATGRRKTSVARVWLTEGNGNVVINKQDMKAYFGRETSVMLVEQPLEITQTKGRFDIHAICSGGGKSGQAGALRHGVSRVLTEVNPEWRSPLKKAGLLTRDPREVERKKYGRAKARKRFQFSKR